MNSKLFKPNEVVTALDWQQRLSLWEKHLTEREKELNEREAALNTRKKSAVDWSKAKPGMAYDLNGVTYYYAAPDPSNADYVIMAETYCWKVGLHVFEAFAKNKNWQRACVHDVTL